MWSYVDELFFEDVSLAIRSINQSKVLPSIQVYSGNHEKSPLDPQLHYRP